MQKDLFIKTICHWYQFNRWGRRVGAWVVPYGPKAWSGAYFWKQEDAWKYDEYLDSKNEN